MGVDKAFLEFDGSALVAIAIGALENADSVTIVGGDEQRLRRRGYTWIPDAVADAGPLVALETALAASSLPRAMVLSCDLPNVTTAAVDQVIEGLRTASCSVPVVGGRMQWLAAAWNVDPAMAACERARGLGLRSLHEMAEMLDRSIVLPPVDHWFTDVDTPEELVQLRQSRDETG